MTPLILIAAVWAASIAAVAVVYTRLVTGRWPMSEPYLKRKPSQFSEPPHIRNPLAESEPRP